MPAFRSLTVVAGLTSPTSITKPTGTASGDLLVAAFMSTQALTVSASGWTVKNATSSSFAPGMVVLERKAGASEPASYSFTVTGAANSSVAGAVVAAYSDADFLRQALINPVSGVDATFPAPTTLAGAADKVVRVAAAAQSSTSGTSTVGPSLGLSSRLSERFVIHQKHWADEDAPGQPRSLSSGTSGPLLAATLVVAKRYPPDSPVRLAPVSGATLRADRPNIFSWQHSHPEGRAQFGFDLRYRVVGAAAWTLVSVSSPNSYHEFPAGTFAEAEYEWQVATYDGELLGPPSSSGFVTFGLAPGSPSILTPVNGETVAEAQVTVTWTGTGDNFQVRSVAEVDGAAPANPTPEQVYYDSGGQSTALGRSWTVPLPVNARRERIQVREEEGSLYGDWADVGILVSYTLPAVAAGSVVPVMTVRNEDGSVSVVENAAWSDALALRVVNPAAAQGQPTRAHNRIIVVALDPGDQYRPQGVERLAAAQFTGSLFVDYRVASGTRYGYIIETVGNNGTVSRSDLITDFRDLGVPVSNTYDAGTFDSAVLG